MIVIAEAGVNHNGSLDTALRLADKAREAGADFVKFQTFHAERLVTATSAPADYQKRNCQATSQMEMLRRLQLSEKEFEIIAAHCTSIGIRFLSTPFDMESIEFLTGIGVDVMKIPSGEITNLPYLRAVGATNLPVILSTGMATLSEVDSAVRILREAGTPQESITLLHCNTEYPTPFTDVNLNVMTALRNAFSLPVGYSDHTIGIEVPIAAAALGAVVIEKHFTLDKEAAGPDHAASLSPKELAEMTHALRNVETALGKSFKTPTRSEIPNIPVARRSIVAACQIRKGEPFTDRNITCKRPGNGLSPMLWDVVVGAIAPCDFAPDQQIHL